MKMIAKKSTAAELFAAVLNLTMQNSMEGTCVVRERLRLRTEPPVSV